MATRRMSFADMEKTLEQTRNATRVINEKQATIDKHMEAFTKAADLQPLVLSETEDFDNVHQNEKIFEENLASMIYALDEVTRAFGDEFKAMSQQTTGEKIMSFLSKRKSEEMRTSRIRSTNINSNLNELISKSSVIQTILIEQKTVLQDRLTKNIEAQSNVLDQAQETAKLIEDVSKEIEGIAPQIASIDSQIAEKEGAERKTLEAQRVKLANLYNDKLALLQTKTAEQQSLEKYSSQYATYIESLSKQKAAQDLLINKLKIDTEQRTVLYDALTESLRTATQQDTAHRINTVGQETDAMAETTMAGIGIAAQNRITSMMEAHEIYMQKTDEIHKKGQIANSEFNRRFADIISKVNTSEYGAKSQ